MPLVGSCQSSVPIQVLTCGSCHEANKILFSKLLAMYIFWSHPQMQSNTEVAFLLAVS